MGRVNNMKVKYYKIEYDNIKDEYTLWQYYTQPAFPTDAFNTWKFDSLVKAQVKMNRLVDEDKNRPKDFSIYYDDDGKETRRI